MGTQKIGIVLLLFVAFTYASTSYSRKVDFKVVDNQDLKNIFIKYTNQIPNYLSPYGIIPWGKMLKGQLEIANPPNACGNLKYDPDQNVHQRPFLLVELDSKCSIEDKIYHAQNHGAQLVILVQKDKDSKVSLEKDQQKLQLISIPVIQVGNDIGQTLLTFTKDSPPQSTPTLIATFPMQDETSNFLRIYADINSIESLQLLSSVGQYNSLHSQKYTIHINYFIPERILDEFDEDDVSEEAKISREEIDKKQQVYCLGKGQYCDKDNPTVLNEIIRQTCLLNNSTETFFTYIDLMKGSYVQYMLHMMQNIFQNQDGEYFDFNRYSQSALQVGNIDVNILDKCYANSFIQTEDSNHKVVPKYQQDNYILSNHRNEFDLLKRHSQLPFVILNHKEIHSKSAEYVADVVKSLCEADNDSTSSICKSLFSLKKNSNKGLNSTQIILIVMGSLAGSVILCYVFARIYSRYQKRRYSSELERVDSLVQSYIELNSDREKQTNT